MMKSKKWVLAAIIGLILVIGSVWIGQRLLYIIGEREIYLAAQDNDYCADEACHEGMTTLVAMLERETGIAAELVPWCMAANAIYTSQFVVLDRLKEKFADWMYRSCGHDDITVEDAVLSIGEPEAHD